MCVEVGWHFNYPTLAGTMPIKPTLNIMNEFGTLLNSPRSYSTLKPSALEKFRSRISQNFENE
jgi:hypothetical protein